MNDAGIQDNTKLDKLISRQEKSTLNGHGNVAAATAAEEMAQINLLY